MGLKLSSFISLIKVIIKVVNGFIIIVLFYFLESDSLYNILWRLKVEFRNRIKGVINFKIIKSISLKSLLNSLFEYSGVFNKVIIKSIDYFIRLFNLNKF